MAFKRSGVRFPSPPLGWRSKQMFAFVGACVDDRSRRKPAPVGSAKRAGIAQLVEHNLAKVGVAGSSPVSRSVVATDATSVRESVMGRRGGANGRTSRGRLAQLVRAPR